MWEEEQRVRGRGAWQRRVAGGDGRLVKRIARPYWLSRFEGGAAATKSSQPQPRRQLHQSIVDIVGGRGRGVIVEAESVVIARHKVNWSV